MLAKIYVGMNAGLIHNGISLHFMHLFFKVCERAKDPSPSLCEVHYFILELTSTVYLSHGGFETQMSYKLPVLGGSNHDGESPQCVYDLRVRVKMVHNFTKFDIRTCTAC